MTAPDSRLIRIAAAVIWRADGCVLVVRKRGSAIFMQPGGKLEPGETPEAALRRELSEELRLMGTLGPLEPLGRFSARAANEPDTVVEAVVFATALDGEATPQAEIEELSWIDPEHQDEIRLAELSRDHILPAWLRRMAGPTRP
jgi:8-oxo-dGTP pyrophosphatase MutT (NUDIX family)